MTKGFYIQRIPARMQISIYPNREIRVVDSLPRAASLADRNANKRDRRRPVVLEPAPSPQGTLDIPLQPSQPPPRARRRRAKLTQKARHRLLHHAGLLDRVDRERQVFCTGTLPGSTEESIRAFCELAPYVVKTLQNYLPRAVGLSAREIKYLWVWELQKRGALHMHVLVVLPSAQEAESFRDAWKEVWCKVLVLAQSQTSVDLFGRYYGGSWESVPDIWQADAQIVRVSGGRYLSKYLSKGSSGDVSLFPPRWYGISSALREDYREWLSEHTVSFRLRWNPSVGIERIRMAVAHLMEQVTGGPVTHKNSLSDASSLDVFGYLKEVSTETLEGVRAFIESSVSELLVKVKRQVNSKDEMLKKARRAAVDYARTSGHIAFSLAVIRGLPPQSQASILAGEEVSQTVWVDFEMTARWELRNWSDAEGRGPSWAHHLLGLMRDANRIEESIRRNAHPLGDYSAYL